MKIPISTGLQASQPLFIHDVEPKFGAGIKQIQGNIHVLRERMKHVQVLRWHGWQAKQGNRGG